MKRTLWTGLVMGLALLLAACGGSGDASTDDGSDSAVQVSAGDPVAGEAQYNALCIACHGPEGIGVEGLGKPFTTSSFVQDNDDAALLAFVKTGRPIGDPANTTGVDMPPKGGNPALNDAQIMDIIAYIRGLSQ